MIKKIAYFSVIIFLTTLIISCEKDFTEIGSSIIDNSKFNTKELILDVEITQQNIDFVSAGNTQIDTKDIELLALGEYPLGIYKKPNAQTLKAGIVSQLMPPTFTAPTLNDGEFLSDPYLDEVILKIPVKTVIRGKIDVETTDDDGNTTTVKATDFRIDSILGNHKAEFTINVYKNNTFLTELDPANPSKKREYLSNQTYLKDGGKLNLSTNKTIKYADITKDTVFKFKRTLSNGTMYDSELKSLDAKKIASPFITIRLDKSKLKDVFDKLINSDLSYSSFKDYFRGIILEAEGDDGFLIPLNLSSDLLKPSIEFISTTTVVDSNQNPILNDNGEVKKFENIYSFKFSGVRTSTYQMYGNAYVANGVLLQGTSGSVASVKILEKDTDNNGLTDLEDLRKKNIIINDARLILDINTNSDTTSTPKRLFLFKNRIDENTGNIVPTHISDLIAGGPNNFDGILRLNNEKPDYYSFNLRQHLSDIVKGNILNSELILRVFNSNDFPANSTDLSVKKYNWNPRSVPLLSNSTQSGTVRGIKLKISYTEEK